jgi:hypothetical protein
VLLADPKPPAGRGRRRAFALVLAACVALAAGTVAWTVARQDGGAGAGEGAARTPLPERGTVVFRSLDHAHPARYRRVGWMPVSGPQRRSEMSARECDRVHFAGGRGLCVTRDRGLLTGFKARTLGRRLDAQADIRLAGTPSRARVSPDGRYGSVTAFVSGHSYATPGAFSTATTLIDMTSGRSLGDLEKFAVTRDGAPFRAVDFNYWGVTFERDSNRFYATLASGAKTFLVHGDVKARTATVVRENAECPSLAPDGTRVAYKKRVGAEGVWRFHVLDLASGHETALAETRSVDDQIEWLDGSRVLYGVGTDVWTVPADGSGSPRRFLADADSPAVLR